MVHQHFGQSPLSACDGPTCDPGEDAWRIPGWLQLHDRTVWWTGRVAIGLTHTARDEDSDIAPWHQPLAADACSEFLEPPHDNRRTSSAWLERVARWIRLR